MSPALGKLPPRQPCSTARLQLRICRHAGVEHRLLQQRVQPCGEQGSKGSRGRALACEQPATDFRLWWSSVACERLSTASKQWHCSIPGENGTSPESTPTSSCVSPLAAARYPCLSTSPAQPSQRGPGAVVRGSQGKRSCARPRAAAEGAKKCTPRAHAAAMDAPAHHLDTTTLGYAATLSALAAD